MRTQRAGERVKASITRNLITVLRLVVNEQKSRVTPISKYLFLGFTFRGTKLRWSDQAFADFQHRRKRFTGRSWGISMAYRLRKLGEYLRGWMGYFGLSDYYRPIHPRTGRVAAAPSAQVLLETVATSAHPGPSPAGAGNESKARDPHGTEPKRKGPWHLARTLATPTGITNQWLAEPGLLSIRDPWIKAHGYA